jgi:hypothetical protein
MCPRAVRVRVQIYLLTNAYFGSPLQAGREFACEQWKERSPWTSALQYTKAELESEILYRECSLRWVAPTLGS